MTSYIRQPTSDSRRPTSAAAWGLALCLFLAAAVALPGTARAAGQQREGCHIEEITDQDGDGQILMESEWISMHLQPTLQSMIVRFVFRPTGNDIMDEIQPKFVKMGGGLIQDNFWEQDWRFSEFRAKPYDYQIVKNTPEEVAVMFETKSEGWLQAVDSGIKSKLLTDIRIRRTVTLRAGAPYFLFDLELANVGKNAKLPMMWVHNSCICDPQQGDQVHRPSVRGLRRIGAVGRSCGAETVRGEEPYVYDFNEGWSARVSASRKEGVVYLMDYDYVQFLYNCGTSTDEWIYDNVLILQDRPWKGRVYVLPVMGLSRVDYANEFFILEVEPQREKGRLQINYRVTASYNPVKRITFNTRMDSDHLTEAPKSRVLDPVEVEKLGVAPVAGSVTVDNPPDDPLLLSITAHVELPDGSVRKIPFQFFHIGGYKFADNIRTDLRTPVAKLERRAQAPFIPVPKADLTVNRKDWKVFAVLGNHASHLRLREIVRSIPARMSDTDDIGFTPGWMVSQSGITDFPFDYQRLFDYRVVLFHNAQPDVARRVGASVLAQYLSRGGGLVVTGGDSSFLMEFTEPNHELNQYLPLKPQSDNLRKGTVQLNSPVADHPVFKGINLASLPYLYYYHDAALKPDLPCKVLLKAGDKPFLIELTRGEQRTLVVLCTPFGDEAANPGKPPLWKWDQWDKLFANIVKYAGHDL